MSHDKNLLKLDQLSLFRAWLEMVGFEVRDGKGAFEVLQVKTGPSTWAVINRNGQGVLSSHPDLKPLIHSFKAASTTIKPKAPAPAAPADDLRDDFAIAALQGLLASGNETSARLLATSAYELADAMLEARKVRP